MKDFAVITVLDNLSETSMPWNEFVLYRYKHNPRLKQYVIVCDKPKPNIIVPDNIDITFTGFDAKKIRQTMNRIKMECRSKKTDYVIHLHQNKSAAFFNLVTFFSAYAKRTLFTVHSQFPAYNLQNKLASLLNASRANRVINVSTTSYNVYPEFVKKIKGNRMRPIENGVDIDRIDGVMCSYTKSERNKKRFVYVARMIPLKRHDFLIDVFHEVNADYELILIGSEDFGGAIRSKVIDCGMSDRVVFTGLIPRDELFVRLADSDVYVSSSTIEGLPVSVLEGMAVGLPAIISDIEPHKEIARYCDAVETLPFDKNIWIDKITQIISTDTGELVERGKKCRAAVVKEFSLQSMHQKYYDEYEKLMNKAFE